MFTLTVKSVKDNSRIMSRAVMKLQYYSKVTHYFMVELSKGTNHQYIPCPKPEWTLVNAELDDSITIFTFDLQRLFENEQLNVDLFSINIQRKTKKPPSPPEKPGDLYFGAHSASYANYCHPFYLMIDQARSIILFRKTSQTLFRTELYNIGPGFTEKDMDDCVGGWKSRASIKIGNIFDMAVQVMRQ